MQNKYLFTSERLGFRNWIDADIPKISRINLDAEVMEFFPSTSSPVQTQEFVARMKSMFEEKGFCYFAADKLENAEFIGFIGLCEQTYEAPFTPCIDIGWRLDKGYWKQGFATEGAQAVLDYAFGPLKLDTILSVAPEINLKSIHIMEKIGMHKKLHFKHPKLLDNERLVNCVCYEIRKNSNAGDLLSTQT